MTEVQNKFRGCGRWKFDWIKSLSPNSKKPKFCELPDESRSVDGHPSSLIDELLDGSKRVDGHPTGNNLTLADRVLLPRFASPARQIDEMGRAVRSFSDGCIWI